MHIVVFFNINHTLNMQFELTAALTDDILFSMEDQIGEFFLDTVEGIVVGGADGPDFPEENNDDGNGGPRFLPLPQWDSASGFRLMERFAAGLKNPLVREDLGSALDRGKGVFRAFKNALGRYPEAEKLWFAFKEREMKQEIVRWYNGLREEWGLEKIGMEPEETGDLVLEDFRFRTFVKEDIPAAEELHRLCLEEYKKNLAEIRAGFSAGILAADSRSDSPVALCDTALTAESGSGEFAGYISAVTKGSVLYIQNLEVKAEFRGLGIGETLLSRLLESVDPDEICQALLDLPSWAEGFSRVLLREYFKPYTVRYALDLRLRAD